MINELLQKLQRINLISKETKRIDLKLCVRASVQRHSRSVFCGGTGIGFFFFFPCPFSAGCPGLILGLFFFFPALIRRAAHVCFHWGFFNEFLSQNFKKKKKKGCFAPLCVPLGLKKPRHFTVSEGHGHPLVQGNT
jgi:hypothetical protein